MHARIIGLTAAFALAGGLAACAPGPGGYAGWSDYRQHQAYEHGYAAQRDAQAAQWEARHGNYYGAQQSQAAANAESARAQDAQAHAERDQWLSHF